MFISTNNLSESGSSKNHTKKKERELYEGSNPKSTTQNWHESKNTTHVNLNWQKLRK